MMQSASTSPLIVVLSDVGYDEDINPVFGKFYKIDNETVHGEIETINKLNASWYVLRHNAQIIREEHFGYGHNGAWLLKSRWSYAPDIQIGRDFDTLLIEAKAGDLRAQVDVGLAYENGTGVSRFQ